MQHRDRLDDLETRHGLTMGLPDVAKLFGVQVRSIQNNISRGTFPLDTYKLAGRRRVLTHDVIDYLRRQREAGNK